jgi:hypothetical protein
MDHRDHALRIAMTVAGQNSEVARSLYAAVALTAMKTQLIIPIKHPLVLYERDVRGISPG